MTYGTRTDAPYDFFPLSLQTHLLILNSHPLLPTAFLALSAPHTHGKQGKQRNLLRGTSIDVDLLELCH